MYEMQLRPQQSQRIKKKAFNDEVDVAEAKANVCSCVSGVHSCVCSWKMPTVTALIAKKKKKKPLNRGKKGKQMS